MAPAESQRRMKIAKTKCRVFNATAGYFRRSRDGFRLAAILRMQRISGIK
jgi:hypothetical protein